MIAIHKPCVNKSAADHAGNFCQTIAGWNYLSFYAILYIHNFIQHDKEIYIIYAIKTCKNYFKFTDLCDWNDTDMYASPKIIKVLYAIRHRLDHCHDRKSSGEIF